MNLSHKVAKATDDYITKLTQVQSKYLSTLESLLGKVRSRKKATEEGISNLTTELDNLNTTEQTIITLSENV